MKHRDIFKYTTIWMDSLRNGQFQLANTNKLIRFYDGATGLKTGSTGNALCCISATAKRDGMHLIAVVMGSPDSKSRFNSARELLNYGFANYSSVVLGEKDKILASGKISKGTKDEISLVAGEDAGAIVPKDKVKDVEILTELIPASAPVSKGDVLGTAVAKLDGEIIASCDLLAAENVSRRNVFAYFNALIRNFMIL